jgi:acyl-CoA thioester hydrolase
MRPIFTHTLEVRFRDCDPMGHVNNAVYLTYLEQARLAHWRQLRGFGARGGDEDAVAASHDDGVSSPAQGSDERVAGLPSVILARVEADFKSPARFGEVLDIRIGLVALGRTSFTYEYEIADHAGRLVATARSVQVMYDYQLGRPIPIPDAIRRQFDSL